MEGMRTGAGDTFLHEYKMDRGIAYEVSFLDILLEHARMLGSKHMPVTNRMQCLKAL